LPLTSCGLGYRVFALQVLRESVKVPRDPLLGFSLLFRGCPNTEPLPLDPGFAKTRRLVQTKRQLAAPPLRFLPLQRLPCPKQRHKLAGFASPDRLRLQVFSTSWRLSPLRACRPYFVPDPLLGSPSKAFLLPRSRALFPAPLPSWRSLRLQGFAPRESPPLGPAV